MEEKASSSVEQELLLLDKSAGSLRKSLESSTVSACLKSEFRGRIEALQSKGIAAKKRASAQKVDVTLNLIQKEIQDEKEEKAFVMMVDIGADSKASQKVMKLCKKQNIAFMGLSEEDPGSGGKLLAFSYVPDELTSQIRADEWIRATLEVAGGRGGGKPGNAQGQAKDCADVKAVEKAARDYLAAKLAVLGNN